MNVKGTGTCARRCAPNQLNHRPTVVFVEHDAAFVERVATKVIDLSR